MYGRKISEALKEISKSFEKNELAYLSLTSKIENPVRDRLAYRLHSDFRNVSTIAAREWKRRDLVILKNGSPKAIIEMKAMYTFDAAKNREISGFHQKLIEDMAKANMYNGVEVYGLLLATHPQETLNKDYKYTVKYLGGINSALKRSSHDILLERAKKNIGCAFKNCETVASGKLTGGTAFGVPVSVHYWLFKA